MKLKALFHISLLLLIITEAYRAYLLMPMPGSQHEPAVETAYFLYHYRWWIRIVLLAGVIVGFQSAFEKRAWVPMITLFFTGMIYYLANYAMTAEAMFKQAREVLYVIPEEADVPMDAIVIGVTQGGESRAYPIRYLAYHHLVPDVVGGREILVTYCDVCRSGAVYDPKLIPGRHSFRLVGMDQWNAMFEDRQTGSWWMQANGQCVVGEYKGQSLEIVPSEQMTLAEWSTRHPNGKVMAAVPEYAHRYSDDKFEKGTDTDPLTRTDTASWQDKSWVLGIEVNGAYRAYDWKQLTRDRVIFDTLGGENVMITIDDQNVNYEAVIFYQEDPVNFNSNPDSMDINFHPGRTVRPIPARQLFWHTWKTFYPYTTRYPND